MVASSAKPVAAQTRVKTVVVLDFENTTNHGGLSLGRKAADAVVLELTPDRYEVIDRDQVQQRIRAMRLQMPLDEAALLKLGLSLRESLGVEQIFTGRVLSTEVRKGTPRQALVKIETRILDISSGEFTNGARGEGLSSPRYDEVHSDVLIDDAVGKAAFAVVQALNTQAIPEGTVLANKGGEVTINIGSQDGVQPGMEMVVLRRGEKVGRIQIESVTNRDAVARVKEETRGVSTEDRVRAVYTATTVTGDAMRDVSKAKRKSSALATIGTVVAGAALLMLTLKMFKSKTPENVGAYGVTARPVMTDNREAGVDITWSRPASPAPPDLIGFRIFRSDNRYGDYTLIAEVEPYQLQYTDTTAARTITVTGTSTTGTGTTGSTRQVPGVQPGVTYYYRVSRLFIQPLADQTTTGTGNNNNNQNANRLQESNMSEPSGGATPVQAPALQAPIGGAAIDPANVTFRWLTVEGGDRYMLQVSDNMSFTGRVISTREDSQQMATAGTVGNVPMNLQFPINSVFAAPSGDPATGQAQTTTLYWRVGVRRSSDGQRPNGGFIFSTPERVTLQPTPPDPAQP